MYRRLAFRRVMLVGRQRLFADALELLLARNGVSSVSIVTDPGAAPATARSARPEVVLIDVDDETDARVRAGREIAEADPAAVVLTVSGEARESRDRPLAFRGHLSKHVGVEAFMTALDAAVKGERVSQRAPERARSAVGTEATFGLTVRERAVLQLLAEAATGREIATRLGISLNTERTHVRSVLWKLQAHSREEAVAKAARRGLIGSRSLPDERVVAREAG